MKKDCSTEGRQQLAAWLVFATDSLVAPARERIELEIEAHFADGVARRVAEGWPLEDAEMAAVLELGEASSAAKAFRKRYLTGEEEARLRKLEDENRVMAATVVKRWWLLVIVLAVWALAAAGFWRLAARHAPSDVLKSLRLVLIPTFAAIFAMFAGRWRCYYLVKHFPTGPELWRKLLGLRLLESELIAIYWTAYIFYQGKVAHFYSPYLNVGVCVLIVLGALFTKRFRLWRKLRYAQTVTDQSVKA